MKLDCLNVEELQKYNVGSIMNGKLLNFRKIGVF